MDYLNMCQLLNLTYFGNDAVDARHCEAVVAEKLAELTTLRAEVERLRGELAAAQKSADGAWQTVSDGVDEREALRDTLAEERARLDWWFTESNESGRNSIQDRRLKSMTEWDVSQWVAQIDAARKKGD